MYIPKLTFLVIFKSVNFVDSKNDHDFFVSLKLTFVKFSNGHW